MSAQVRSAGDDARDVKKQKTEESQDVKNKVCLIIHDGWGLSDNEKGNAVFHADTSNMDRLAKEYAYTTLQASGTGVGLPEGTMGNSEVGHLNAGAGRIVWMDVVKIDEAIKKNTLKDVENIKKAMQTAKTDSNGRLHLMGLISDGGVHSHLNHLKALLKIAKEAEVPHVYIHFFGDGRDTAPKSAAGYLKDLLSFVEQEKVGEVSTIVGRYYAMDRDKRWERVKVAADALVKGEGEKVSDALKAVEDRYAKDETDEFLKPIICGSDDSRLKENDSIFFFNFRSDRARELCTVLGFDEKPAEGFEDVPKNIRLTTMTRYNPASDWDKFPVAFPPASMANVLAEWLAKQETEKYAHVTFFFNGGVEKQFEGEDRVMIPSPKVATYDMQPEMSVAEVGDKTAEILKEGKYEFVVINTANCDMVGHTGNFEAAVKAVSAVDKAVGVIARACEDAGYVLVVTADHGNAEEEMDKDGNPMTAHTTNPIPLIVTQKDLKLDSDGCLADVAPTVLALMGLPQPEEMTGRSLIKA